MTKEELEKEAKTECFMLTVNTIGIDQRDVELAYVMGAEPREKRIAELEKENAELKKENQKWKDGIALKDEEIGCIETDFNTFKSKAKEILKAVVDFYPTMTATILLEAEQFLNSEVEK